MRELAQNFLHFLRCLVVFAECIWQPGIRVTGNKRIRYPRQFLQIRAQFLCAERTVQTDEQRVSVRNRIPEGFGCLARQGSPTCIGNRAGNKDRQIDPFVMQKLFDRKYRCFGVQGVEYRLDQQYIGATVDKPRHGLGINIHQLFKSGVPESRIVDVRRDRGRSISRTQNTGHKTRLVRRIGADIVGHAPGNTRSFVVQGVNMIFHTVIGHGDRGGIEGVGLQNIDARVQKPAVNFLDHIGQGQRQQIVIAFLGKPVVDEPITPVVGLFQLVSLYHCAHRAIDDQDSLLQQSAQFFSAIGLTLLRETRAHSA